MKIRKAWIAGAVGLICALFFSEASRLVLTAVGLFSAWQAATAVRVLLAR